MRIIALIPAKDEEEKIGIVVRDIRKYANVLVDEVLVIDDCSSDKTVRVAEKSSATVISQHVDRSVGAAIRTVIDHDLQKNYDICVIMGGDAQGDPREICRVVSPIINDGYAFVRGSRFLGEVITFPMSRKTMIQNGKIITMSYNALRPE